jgi:hypothetical protein
MTKYCNCQIKGFILSEYINIIQKKLYAVPINLILISHLPIYRLQEKKNWGTNRKIKCSTQKRHIIIVLTVNAKLMEEKIPTQNLLLFHHENPALTVRKNG